MVWISRKTMVWGHIWLNSWKSSNQLTIMHYPATLIHILVCIPVHSSRTSHDSRVTNRTLTTGSQRRLSISKLLSISKAGPLRTKDGFKHKHVRVSIYQPQIIDESKQEWNQLHIISLDVPNMLINKTRMFAWYLPDRSPKPESKCFNLTGTGVADGSYWDTKAKANVM